MPTKPDPVNDLPPAWGGAGNYPATNYPATLPDLSGQANPLVGATPWSGQPRLNATGLTSFANSGLEPQVPNDASVFNEWLRRVQVWSQWVSVGTSAPDADAHIVESSPLGLVSAQAFQAEQGVTGAGAAAPVILLMGYDVPASETSTIGDNTTTTYGDNATISGGNETIPSFEGYELASEQASTGNRQIHHLNGEPRWRDGDDTYLHHGAEPWGPVSSFPPLSNFGPTSLEIDGPSVSVTVVGTAFVHVTASGAFLGTAADTVAGIRVEVDSVDVYDEAFEVFNTDRPLVWSVSFAVQEGAGTFDVKIKFRRSAGSGSVNLDASSIFALVY